MPFVGDKGNASYPSIKRARLVTGDTYLQEGSRTPSPGDGYGGSGGRFSSWVPSDERRKRTWGDSGMAQLSSTNIFGLTSRSESMFPEAFKPIDTKFWVPMSQEERSFLVARQAAANLKATYDDDEHQALASTSADSQYADAQSRRNQSIKRRKTPRNMDERKKEEELKRKDPLQRRYTGPMTTFYRDSAAIVSTGPIGAPILVNGLPTTPVVKPGRAPSRLKKKRTARARMLEEPRPEVMEPPDPILPTFNPDGSPKAIQLGGWNNQFGLRSRSEMMYPEAYADISTVYWKSLSEAERTQIRKVQARAMERVGYEPGTERFFIPEIDPVDDYIVKRGGRRDDTAGGGRTLDISSVIVTLLLLACLAVFAWGVIENMENVGGVIPAEPDLSGGSGGE